MPGDIESRILQLSDLLKVIEHMHEMEGANGLSAVIAAAQEHVDSIANDLDDMADKVALKGVGTPVMNLFREWMELREHTNALVDKLPEGQSDEPFYAPIDALAKRILETPPVTASDFAAKAIVDSCFGAHDRPWKNGKFWTEACKLVGMQEAA